MKFRFSFSSIVGVTASLAVAISGLSTLQPSIAWASGSVVRYVASSGSVGNGTSCASPSYVGTTHVAIQRAIDDAAAGDTVHICSGTFSIGTRLNVAKSLTLTGNGSYSSFLDGGNSSQILMLQDINPAVTSNELTVNVSRLSFLNGRATGQVECTDGEKCGGAIFIEGETRVNISDSYFKNNYAGFVGGAVARFVGDYRTVPSTITNSTFESNTAELDGGGVATLFGFGLVISHSTFVRNSINQRSGAALIANFANASVDNSTFIDNTGPAGTTVLYGGLNLEHSIVAQSSQSMIKACIAANQTLSGTRGNLVTDNTCGVTDTFPATPATNSAIVNFNDLKFGTLSYRGYENKTVPLLAGSVALNFRNTSCSGNDQHGFVRPQGTNCDVGAYERPSNQETNVISGWTYPSATFNRVSSTLLPVSTPAVDSSGLGVVYSSSTPSVCSINDSTGAITGISNGTCTVSASVDGYLLSDEVSTSKSITLTNFVTPSNSVPPSFAGTLRPDFEMVADEGSWTESPTSYDYQWMRASTQFGTFSNIAGATDSVYQLTDDDVEKYLRVRVTAQNPVGESNAEDSPARGPVADRLTLAMPSLSTAVSVSGGFTFTITNYSVLNTYTVTATDGRATRVGDEVQISGLGSNESSTVSVRVSRAGYTSETKSISGRSITASVTTTTAPATVATAPASVETTTASVAVTTVPVSVGQSAIATIAPGVTTTSVPSPSSADTQRVNTNQVTVTTLPALATPISSGETAPSAPSAALGSAGVVVDGVESSVTVTRSNNTLNVSGGGVIATVSGVSPTGERISLDDDGNLRLSDDDQIVVEASGFVSGEEIGVWMFSTPTQLGSLTADVTGKIAGRFELPADIESGDHRLVLEGVNSDGSPVIVGLGLAIGEIESSSTLARLLIAVPVALAIIFGLVIPNTLRRRRRESALV